MTAQIAYAADSLVLVDFYDATGGDNWISNAGWLSSQVRNWKGIALNSDGRVVKIMLWNNQLSGQVPLELAELLYLEELDLSYNTLNGPIPPELAKLTTLRQLKLGGNELSGAIPPELADLQGLTWLTLDYNQLSGTIPPVLADLSRLKALWLSGNQLEGQIPSELADLTNLNGLLLHSNQLSGPIPVELAGLKNLESLWLGTNHLSGPIPPELGALSRLGSLRLGSNMLSDSIPRELGNLSNLHSLHLEDNALRGEIPTELSQLTELSTLRLNSNNLSGTVPAWLGQLSKLKRLSLGSNQLSGSIPLELGDLTGLEELRLNDNVLTGALPAGLVQARRLRWLFVQNNRLNGLPDLSENSYLDSVDVSNNRMTFEDLEPNAELTYRYGRPWFAYVPQDSINTRLWRTLTDIVFTVSTGGERNRYQWFRNGQPISGATAAQLKISKDSRATAVYHAEVKHPYLRGLTLVSRPLSSDAMPTHANEAAPNFASISLHPNYPNPVVGITHIQFDVERLVPVRIQVYDTLGRLVRTLVDEHVAPGRHRVAFDATGLAPGLYHCQMQAGDLRIVQSLTVLR